MPRHNEAPRKGLALTLVLLAATNSTGVEAQDSGDPGNGGPAAAVGSMVFTPNARTAAMPPNDAQRAAPLSLSAQGTRADMRSYTLTAVYFRHDEFGSTADCLTVAHMQRLPLDLCR